MGFTDSSRMPGHRIERTCCLANRCNSAGDPKQLPSIATENRVTRGSLVLMEGEMIESKPPTIFQRNRLNTCVFIDLILRYKPQFNTLRLEIRQCAT